VTSRSFGVNQWIEQKKVITSLDLAKRTEILPGLSKSNGIYHVDEAHRMSWKPQSRKNSTLCFGDFCATLQTICCCAATPHKSIRKFFIIPSITDVMFMRMSAQ
jgi:hypothetical protein